MQIFYIFAAWRTALILVLRKLYYYVFKREFAARESVSFELFKSSALAMPGRGKRANSTAKAIIYNVYKYFEKESAKNKLQKASEINIEDS